ncbi:Palmitoyltransferase ZDHHC15 isoform X3 [Aphelenchoides bicaudatus]|nr:Palmitoyltransferase ZDHHC15 isoform X3 [Aphelenchoides bicaudatus]
MELLFNVIPLIPSKFSIGEDFFKQSQEERNRRANEVIDKAGLNRYHVTKLCPTCKIVRPERAHHCAICNLCTPRMDHHCVVLHKCIHNKNQKQFTLFFFWMCFSLAFGIMSFHPYIMRSYKEAPKEVKETGWLNYPIALYTWHYTRYLGKFDEFPMITSSLVITTILTYFLIVMFGGLLINFTWFCNIRNGTILDCNKAMIPSNTFPWVTRRRTNTRCFRKPTKLQNFQVIFGKDWRFWVIPIAISDNDGWLHSCDCELTVVKIV